jgi:hypothetical protein
MSDAVLDPDALAAWAATQPPGPGVADVLATLDAAELSHQGRLDYLAASEGLLGWAQARQHRMLAALSAAEPRERLEYPDKRWVTEEVACLLRLASPSATARLALAEAITSPTGRHQRTPAATYPIDTTLSTTATDTTTASTSTSTDPDPPPF